VEPVRVLSPELVLVDWGPMTLTISAWRQGAAAPVIAARAAREALSALAVLADFQGYLRRPVRGLPAGRPLPPVVARAADAARAAGGGLTPLAAVAGAAADQVARAAADLGADRVVVNNGGDIALRLAGRARVRVGLAEPAGPSGARTWLGALELGAADGVGGVATSGWQGRSLSPGVADVVTCWAADAAAADAAATLVAGACRAASPAVRRARARELDPASDLGRRRVTVAVGRLDGPSRLRALRRGLAAAQRLARRGRLMGCVIKVQEGVALLDARGLASLDRPARLALAG
jgi:hypothetical protein